MRRLPNCRGVWNVHTRQLAIRLLRKTLHSTNPIESLFSRGRACERNIKRYRNSKMAQRWLASVLLYGEKSFRTVKGHEHIQVVVANIGTEQATISSS